MNDDKESPVAGINPKTKAHIDQIKADLGERLEKSARKIALLDNIRARSDKTATQEEQLKLSQ